MTVKASDGYVRANAPGAVLNTDTDALKQYKIKKQKASEMDTLREDVKEMKAKFESIESMLRTLINKA